MSEDTVERFRPAVDPIAGPVRVAGMRAVLDASGALYWPEQDTLVVSDLHLETGAAHARRRCFVPPYDTHATLLRLESVVRRFRPRRMVSLGDSFHDVTGAEQLSQDARARIAALAATAETIWVTGNHDRETASVLPGTVHDAVEIGGVVFRHIPESVASGATAVTGVARSATGSIAAAARRWQAPADFVSAGSRSGDVGHDGPTDRFEVAGHMHPAVRIAGRGMAVRRRCFVGCGRRLIMPAFGVLTGGLNVCDPAYTAFWPSPAAFRAFAIARAGVFAIRPDALMPG